jgi:hypothetical protein
MVPVRLTRTTGPPAETSPELTFGGLIGLPQECLTCTHTAVRSWHVEYPPWHYGTAWNLQMRHFSHWSCQDTGLK